MISATGTLADINPIRHRGYYYDQETGLYHLWSRYYDPQTGRFLSPDSYASTGQDMLGYNMFAYCLNNPANYSDPSGNSSISYRKASDEFLSGTFNFIGLGGGGAAGIGSLIVTLEVIEFGVNMASRGERTQLLKLVKIFPMRITRYICYTNRGIQQKLLYM